MNAHNHPENLCFCSSQKCLPYSNSFRSKLNNKFQIESNIIRSRLGYFHKSVHLVRKKVADDYVDWVAQCKMTMNSSQTDKIKLNMSK